MSFFLDEPWLTVLSQAGMISRKRPINVNDRKLWVGEYQNFGQRKWILYGSWDEHNHQGLEHVFRQAHAAGIFQVECAFNMARWTNREILETVGATITEPFGTYVVDLSLDEQTLWSGLHGKHRNMVRRAEKDGLEIRFNLDLDPFIALMNETYARGNKNNPFPRTYFEHLFSKRSERMLLIGAFSPAGLEAGAIVPYDMSRGWFLHGASRDNGFPGAANLVHWRTMLALRDLSVGRYDLGGARQHTDDPRLQGIFRFKERFGGMFEPCWYWCKTIHPTRKIFHDLLYRYWR